jgi:hypothetical protein
MDEVSQGNNARLVDWLMAGASLSIFKLPASSVYPRSAEEARREAAALTGKSYEAVRVAHIQFGYAR